MKSEAPDMQAIVKRMDKLERQNRRLKFGGFVILGALSAVVLMGQAAPAAKVIEAQKFVLKDADGNVRGWFGAYAAGSELILGNAKKQPQMRLMASEDGSDLHFFGSRNGGMTLSVNSGNPKIAIAGADGNGGVAIRFSEAGPSVTVNDRAGFSAVIGATQLKSQARSEARATSAASVVLFDRDKNAIWQSP
jgi:hypothetical protein